MDRRAATAGRAVRTVTAVARGRRAAWNDGASDCGRDARRGDDEPKGRKDEQQGSLAGGWSGKRENRVHGRLSP